MAMSGGTAKLVKSTKSNYGNGFDIKLYVYVKSSQSVADNNSDLKLGMYIVTPSGYNIGKWDDFNGSYVGTATSGTNCKSFNGTIPSGTDGTYWICQDKSIDNVAHNSDGTKTVTIYWKLGVNSPWGQFVNPSGSFSVTLPQIPRASDFTISGTGTTSAGHPYVSINDTNKITVNISRKVSTFKHTVQLYYGSEEMYKEEKKDTSFSVPLTMKSWLGKLPNAKNTTSLSASKAPSVKVTTYDANGKPVGSPVSKRWDIYVPDIDAVKPTVKLTVAPNHNITDSDLKNLYIQGKSKLSCSATYTYKFDTSPKSQKITVDGATYKSPSILNAPGEITVNATTTDLRGYSGDDSEKITVISYEKPYLSNIVLERSDEDGNFKEDGTRIHFRCTRNYSSVNGKNKAVVKVGSHTIPEEEFINNECDYVLPDETLLKMEGKQYSISITDRISKETTYSRQIPTAFCTFHLAKGGRKAAFGGYADDDDDTLSVYWNLQVMQDDGNFMKINDTGWIDLGLSSNVSERNGAVGRASYGCKYRVINNRHVYVAFACQYTFSGSAVVVNGAPLPQQYRPPNNVYSMCATGGRAIARCLVNNDGEIYLDWIQILSSAEQTTSSQVSWVDGYIDYWI